jgi:DNA-binding NtrC family response regulator
LVLLVERDLASRLSSANELLDDGYEVVETESASEAMSVLDGRHDFDAIVADIHPDRAPGGLALVRYGAIHHPSMKILVDSDWTGACAEASAIAVGFLPKPYFAGALVEHMDGLLAPTWKLLPLQPADF